MPVTIYQIAKAAGVSSSTVARVLRPNFTATRSDATARADRIRQLADEMGYRPNAQARALSTGKSDCVGLIYATDEYLFEGVHGDIFLGVTRTLHAGGFHLAFCPLQDDRGWRHVIEEGRIDGAFLFGTPPAAVEDALRLQGIPIVMLATDAEPSAPSIVVDDVAGGRLATEHLLELGHTQIAFWVHPEIADHCSVGQRLDGYNAAMREHGCTPRPMYREPVEAVRDAVRAPDGLTALVCYCDHEALVVQQMLWREGLSAPRDLSFVAFNDKKAMQLMTPPLTTIGFDAVGLGSAGAEKMMRLIRSSDNVFAAPQPVVVPPNLIVRESTAPPTRGRRIDINSPPLGGPH